MIEGLLSIRGDARQREWFEKLAPFSTSANHTTVACGKDGGSSKFCHREKHSGSQHASLAHWDNPTGTGRVADIWFSS